MFGALTAISALCLTKAQHGGSNECRINRFCSKCKLLSDCEMPEAQSEKSQKSVTQNL